MHHSACQFPKPRLLKEPNMVWEAVVPTSLLVEVKLHQRVLHGMRTCFRERQFSTYKFRNICIVYLQLCRKHSPSWCFLPIFDTGKGCQDNGTRKDFPYVIPCIVPVTLLLQMKKLVIRKGSKWCYWQFPLELPFFYCMVGSGMDLTHRRDGCSQFGPSQWKSRHGLCTPHLPPPWTPQRV